MNTATMSLSKPEIASQVTPVVEVPSQDMVENCAFAHGTYPDSYLITEPGYRHFWDHDRTGCIGYFQDGRYLHVVGGIVAPPHRKAEVLRQFSEFNDQHRYLSSFFSISEADLPVFREQGYQVTKFGEHADLSLAGHSWQGKPYSWIRRQVSFVTRQGLVAREVELQDLSASEWSELYERLDHINRQHLGTRPFQHEIGLLEGRLFREHFYRRRLFVAHPENAPEDWEAFVACTPIQAGRGWATEMYRSRPGSVRGVIPFLIASIVDQLREEGSEQVSLCMVPAINCTTPLPGDSRLARFMFGLWEKRLHFIFNSRGLYHFKSRFRPEFSPAYLCVRPRITLGSTLSFMKMVGVFQLHRFDWRKVLRTTFSGNNHKPSAD